LLPIRLLRSCEAEAGVFNISFLQHKINETDYGLISLLREKYLIYKFAKTPASASQERISLLPIALCFAPPLFSEAYEK
jgi:hypothetical protein